MTTLMQASHQWATRPSDERFVSLSDLHAHCVAQHDNSRATVISSHKLQITADAPDGSSNGLKVYGANGHGYAPTNWAFGQLASLVGAPAGYLRELPAPIAADCLNVGLIKRDVADVGVLLRRSSEDISFAAATGPNYGRVWNADITRSLVKRFGDGVSGDWRVPGEFGARVAISKANTTLFASDRDMFVFLADETNRISIPNRRNGEAGSLARGFFVWNSETGSKTLGVKMFLFDYVCCNRIVWGAEDVQTVTVRHTSRAPDRWLGELAPMLNHLHNASAAPIEAKLLAAQQTKVDDLADFLKRRAFANSMAGKLQNAHMIEEGCPIETIWDVTTAMTAHAKGIEFQDERVKLETEAGKILELAA